VPLSIQAQAEARVLMLSTQNLFSPADGRPVVSPIQDIVLGCYALTFTTQTTKEALLKMEEEHEKNPEKNPAPHVYEGPDAVVYALDSPSSRTGIKLNDFIKVRI